jgi:hypothetical protein
MEGVLMTHSKNMILRGHSQVSSTYQWLVGETCSGIHCAFCSVVCLLDVTFLPCLDRVSFEERSWGEELGQRNLSRLSFVSVNG